VIDPRAAIGEVHLGISDLDRLLHAMMLKSVA
jgi:hypothetical protein